MKKRYITPDMEIIHFSTEDIITTSSIDSTEPDTATLEEKITPQVNDFQKYFN